MLAWSMGIRVVFAKAVKCNLSCIVFFYNGESSTEALKRGFIHGQVLNSWFLDMMAINTLEIHPQKA